MSAIVFDRVCETTTSTGTGNLTLAGAITGFFQFYLTAGISTSFNYLIEAVDSRGVATGDFEVGVGQVTDATTFQRLAVIIGSNGDNTLVSFAAGTKRVHLTAVARQVGFCGGKWHKTTNLTGQNFTSETAIQWNTEDFSTEVNTPFHSNSVNPDRITLDGSLYAGSLLRVEAQISLANITANEVVTLRIKDDLGTVIGIHTVEANVTTPRFQITSGIYQLASTTRYFQVTIQTAADTTVDIIAADSWVQLEVLQ